MNKTWIILGHRVSIENLNWKDELIRAIRKHPRAKVHGNGVAEKVGFIVALRANSHLVPVGELEKEQPGQMAGLRACKEFVEENFPHFHLPASDER